MTSQEFDEWMSELRSNKYTKLRGAMGQDNTCCALGVYLNHCGKTKSRFERFTDLKLVSVPSDDIANLNDSTEFTFPEIANYIENTYRSFYVKD
jgi:hypothetical protein